MEAYLQTYKRKRILVTGGLGFIGSNLVHKLAQLGDNEVVVVDSLNPRFGGNLFNVDGLESTIKLNVFDLCDAKKLDPIVQRIDYIFNLAGQVSHVDSMKDPYTDLESNCHAHLSLLESCRKSNPTVKIVFASTRQVYGRPNYLPVDEEHPKSPTDINGIHKLMCEAYHALYHAVYGIWSTSLRLTNTYGPRQLLKHPRQGFVSWFIRKAIDGEEIPIFGSGGQLRDLTYVDDVVDAILRAGASELPDVNVYNLGGDRPVSLVEFTKTLISLTGHGSYKLIPFPPDSKAIDVGDYYADYSKIRNDLGWKPKTSLEEGLSQTIAFYRKYRDKYWN